MGQGQFLYIPLCFLLINPPRIHLKSGLVSLHSTMFSINPRCAAVESEPVTAFTFHYVFY